MLNFVLPLLKNPLAKIVVDKTVGAIQHKMEKDKIVRAKEIEAEKNVSIEQIKSAKGSIKDEVLTIKITIIFLAIFWFINILQLTSTSFLGGCHIRPPL